jgi:hypothetical protein
MPGHVKLQLANLLSFHWHHYSCMCGQKPPVDSQPELLSCSSSACKVVCCLMAAAAAFTAACQHPLCTLVAVATPRAADSKARVVNFVITHVSRLPAQPQPAVSVNPLWAASACSESLLTGS